MSVQAELKTVIQGSCTEDALGNNHHQICREGVRWLQEKLVNSFYLPLNSVSEKNTTPFQMWSHISDMKIMEELFTANTDRVSGDISLIKKHFSVSKELTLVHTADKTIEVASLLFESLGPTVSKKGVLFVGGNQDLFSSQICISAGPFMTEWIKHHKEADPGLKVRLFCWTNQKQMVGDINKEDTAPNKQPWQAHTVDELTGLFGDWFNSKKQEIDLLFTFSLGTFIFSQPSKIKLDGVKVLILNRPIPSTEKVAKAIYPGLCFDVIKRNFLVCFTKCFRLEANPEKDLESVIANNQDLDVFIQEAVVDHFASGASAWSSKKHLGQESKIVHYKYVARRFQSAESQHSLPISEMVNITNGQIPDRDRTMLIDLFNLFRERIALSPIDVDHECKKHD